MKNISKIKKSAGLPCATRAFTLIEMLVVIAIIALLTGIVVTSTFGAKQKARDAKRVSDLGTIQVALELYYDRCKAFPSSNPTLDLTDNNGCESTSITLGSFLSVIPVPPLPSPDGATSYEYTPVDTNSDTVKDNYYLRIVLETNSVALQDDIDDAPLSWNSNPISDSCSDVSDIADNQYCLISN